MTDDYALEPVPEGKSVSAFRIAMVSVGIVVALPAFICGAEIGFALGFRTGALAIVLGGVFLSLIAMATGTVGARTRLNTAMITKLTFGFVGGRIVSVILALSLLGWFGVTAELFGHGVHEVVGRLGWYAVPEPVYTVIGGLLMTSTTVFGFAALQRLSNVTVPLLAALIAWTAWLTLHQGPADALLFGSGLAGSKLGDGISAIVGGLSVAVTVFPDLARFSRTAREARISAILTYGLAMPAVLLLAMIPSVLTHERDLIMIMATVGLGAPALILLVVKAWATNAGNLYSAALGAANALSMKSQKAIVVVAGGIGTVLAVAGISDQFVPFLIVLGVCIPPIAGIYVVDFIARPADAGSSGKAIHYGAFCCWMIGIGVTLLAQAGMVTITSIPSADSVLFSAGSFLVLKQCRAFLAQRIIKAQEQV